MADAARAITSMQVRGAPLIGATAAYGLCLAVRRDPSGGALRSAFELLLGTRPTGVNLRWALDDMMGVLRQLPPGRRAEAAYRRAAEICDEDVEICAAIGDHGLALIERAWEGKGKNRPRQPAHPLQRRLAGRRWTGARRWPPSTRPTT